MKLAVRSQYLQTLNNPVLPELFLSLHPPRRPEGIHTLMGAEMAKWDWIQIEVSSLCTRACAICSLETRKHPQSKHKALKFFINIHFGYITLIFCLSAEIQISTFLPWPHTSPHRAASSVQVATPPGKTGTSAGARLPALPGCISASR